MLNLQVFKRIEMWPTISFRRKTDSRLDASLPEENRSREAIMRKAQKKLGSLISIPSLAANWPSSLAKLMRCSGLSMKEDVTEASRIGRAFKNEMRVVRSSAVVETSETNARTSSFTLEA